MTHTQQHGLYGQTEAMTRQNHKYSLKLVMNAQHLSNGKRSDKNFRSLGCAYLPICLSMCTIQLNHLSSLPQINWPV